MKKFLSLVLALVMTMSLVTVSAGATDFDDDESITYDEAVSVLSAVNVIDGYTDGTFKPTNTLTRGAAAKIICNLILGPTTAAALVADTAPYSDVPVTNNFAGYIAFCQKEGIISGYADGTFKPANSLTGYAFMKMLLGALGYSSEIQGYTGDNWGVNVAKTALGIGLNKGLEGAFNGSKTVNREEACLYALNTLKATMVAYDTTITAEVNGVEVTLGNPVATDVKWNIASSADGNIKNDGYVQFAEKYFPNLELEVGEGIYGRPANTWKNKKSEIGTFTSIDPTYVYTESMEEGDVYKDLGSTYTNDRDYDWYFYINGVEQNDGDIPAKNSEDEWVYTGEGTVTEIYIDDDNDTVTVVEINYYLGQVTKVKSDDDGEYITVSALSKGATGLDDKTFYVEGYAEDDYVVFTMDENDDDDMVIGEVFEPETVTGTVTRVEKDTDADNGKVTGETYLKMGSDKYTYTEDPKDDPTQQRHMVYDLDDLNVVKHPTLDEDYILYLDPNGYVLGFVVAEEVIDQYLFITDSDEEMRDWVAKAYLSDGTYPKIDVDDELYGTLPTTATTVPADPGNKVNYADYPTGSGDTVEWVDSTGKTTGTKDRTNIDNLIWKYTVSSKGVYELTFVPIAASATATGTGERQYYMSNVQIHNGRAYVTTGVDSFIVDKNTLFVDVDNEVVYTGYDEVPNVEHGKVAYVMDGKVAEVVFILDGDIYDENNIYFMLADTTRESFQYDGSDYWEYSKAYVGGVKTPLNIKYNADRSNSNKVLEAAPTLYQVKKTVDEDYITEVVKVTTSKYDVLAVGSDAFWLDIDGDGSSMKDEAKFDVNDETVFVVVEKDLDNEYRIYDGRLDDMDDSDYDIEVQVLEQDDQTAELVYIYRDELAAPSDETGLKTFKVKGVDVVNGKVTINSVDAADALIQNVELETTDPSASVTVEWKNPTFGQTDWKTMSTWSDSADISGKANWTNGDMEIRVTVKAPNGDTKEYYAEVDYVAANKVTIKTSADGKYAIVAVGTKDAVEIDDTETTSAVVTGSTLVFTIKGSTSAVNGVAADNGARVYGDGNGTYTVSGITAATTVTITLA